MLRDENRRQFEQLQENTLARLKARIPVECPLLVERLPAERAHATRVGFRAHAPGCEVKGRAQVVSAFVDGYVACWEAMRATTAAYEALREHLAAEKRCDFVEHAQLQADYTEAVRLYRERDAQAARYHERLQIDPGGSDAIDGLQGAVEILRDREARLRTDAERERVARSIVDEALRQEHEQVRELAGKVQFLVDWADGKELLEEHVFTFPDGDIWEAKRLAREEPRCHACGESAEDGHAEDCPWLLEQLRAERPSITCPRCRRVSFHPQDIAERYCGHCHLFHDQMTDAPR